MPSRFREVLSASSVSQLVVSIDVQGLCLTMYPLAQWEEMEQRLMSLPSLHDSVRRMQNMIIGNAFETEMDGNSRISIPPQLRKQVGLDKKITMVGQGSRLEIWSEEAWEARFGEWKEVGPNSLADLPDSIKDMVLF